MRTDTTVRGAVPDGHERVSPGRMPGASITTAPTPLAGSEPRCRPCGTSPSALTLRGQSSVPRREERKPARRFTAGSLPGSRDVSASDRGPDRPASLTTLKRLPRFRLKGLPQKPDGSMEAVVLDGNLSTRYGGGPPPPARLHRTTRTERQGLKEVLRRTMPTVNMISEVPWGLTTNLATWFLSSSRREGWSDAFPWRARNCSSPGHDQLPRTPDLGVDEDVGRVLYPRRLDLYWFAIDGHLAT